MPRPSDTMEIMASPLLDSPEVGAADNQSTANDPNAPYRHKKWAVVAALTAFSVMAIYWALIFTGQFGTSHPDKLDNTKWAVNAESICAPVAAAFKKLPNASDMTSADARADLVDRGTAMLEPMVAKLRTDIPTGKDDRTIVTGWFKDWDSYLADRHAFAKALRSDPAAKPLLTQTHGGWNTDAIDAMATGNAMYSCTTPKDM